MDFKRVKLLLMDVDGVLTTGKVIYDDSGAQIKAFHVKDGLGIRMLMDFGIQVGIITGRKSTALAHRCADLGIDLLYQGIRDKAAALNEILDKTGVSAMETAFVGDDLPDLAVMKRVGVPVAVADSCKEILASARFITTERGGRGAVREICEAVLKAKGFWPKVVERFDT
jgi:3-deoxy-D-manno-octulosonate 8-phosphate phosphatase (KDO 8-P phosphatase)